MEDFDEKQVQECSQLTILNGYHILKNVLSKEFVEQMKEAVLNEFNHQKENGLTRSRGEGRWQIELHNGKGNWLHEELVANAKLISVLWELLGNDMVLASAVAHIAEPNAVPQPPHIDFEPLFNQYLPLPPYCVYLHIPLVDVDESTGAMELWVGSPHMALSSTNVGLSEFSSLPIEKLTSKIEPMEAGDVMVKDMRCFHRGTSNPSSIVRPVLSLIFTRKWYRLPYENFYERNGYPPFSVPKTVDSFPSHISRMFRFCSKSQ